MTNEVSVIKAFTTSRKAYFQLIGYTVTNRYTD
jgi:hypothetical protein